MAKKFTFNPTSGQLDIISEVTLAAVGSTPNANAASIAADQTLNLQPADATNPGVVTTGTQTFAGAKTFSSTIVGTTTGNVVASTGDISQTSFSAANNISSPTNVTGLAFANGTVRSFEALVSVYVNATSSLYESFKLYGIQRGADWQMAQTSVGDTSGFTFTITTAGQVQYISNNYSGFSAATLKFRAMVTSV